MDEDLEELEDEALEHEALIKALRRRGKGLQRAVANPAAGDQPGSSRLGLLRPFCPDTTTNEEKGSVVA